MVKIKKPNFDAFKFKKNKKREKKGNREQDQGELELDADSRASEQEKSFDDERPLISIGWDNKLFQCMDDCETCWYGLCCPTCALATVRMDLDGSNWCFNTMFLNHCNTRFIVRHSYGIQGSGCCGDICYGVWCGPCLTCQLQNEVDTRGPPLAHTVRSRPHPGFHTSLFSCYNDPKICLKGCFCTQCAMADALEALDNTEWAFAFWCIPIPLGRSLLKSAYHITEGESCAMDILLGVCCPQLAVCQMLNEVARRGRVKRKYQEEEGHIELPGYSNPLQRKPPPAPGKEEMKR
mmetsp:Transcript_13988/g.17877  ORF Transcript_13988/g.17877 Transcript_13988/m.17877 type:complete len:293 (-) Transcript_13988:311-1189(-)